MSVRHGVTITTINTWGRRGLLKKHRYDNFQRYLYEPVNPNAIHKGQGGRPPKQPTFNGLSGVVGTGCEGSCSV